MSNIIAIVGRPNTGKSTFFNRLTESRLAIVHETSGVTRDRHYGKVFWNGKEFSVIDTGGYVANSEDVFEGEINKQVMLAIEEADLIIFLVDVNSGITDLDNSIAGLLRKSGKKVLVGVNKVDGGEKMHYIHEFHSLGLGSIYPISSANGSGTGDFLDAIVNNLTFGEPKEEEEDIPRFAIIGRPNVGKSSLINALIGEERNIVTPVAGTTRDSVNTRFKKYNHDFYIMDTAGLRKKGKVSENVEFYSVMRSVRAIENADVCLLLIDAERGIEGQDVNIFRLVERNRKGIVILVNKWDLVEKETNTLRDYEKAIRKRLEPFDDVPIIFTSAVTRQRIQKVLDTAMEVYVNRKQKIPTSKLNEVMQEAIENYHPPAVRGKFIKIKYVTQLRTYAPTFAFFCNLPEHIKDPYRRYLENKIRDHFNFKGVPIQIFFRKK
ncbi:MAG TPA: ribosome biogenesis GTPase Der [Bacteroidales bacterium]|nr:ribosome biogenesis GTPase Der [Bacteroidales bacterium]